MYRLRRPFPQSLASARLWFSTKSGRVYATEQVEQFLAKAEAQSIDPRIVLQKVPELMLLLIDDASKESGPMVNTMLKKLRKYEPTLSPRIYAMAIEAWLKSSNEDTLDEAMNLVQELLSHHVMLENLDSDEKDIINSIFAQVIYALLEKVGRFDDSMHHLRRAEALEAQLLQLHRDGICQPNTTSCNARIALMGAKGNARDATALLETMIQAEDCGETRMAPNAISYNSVLHACAKAGEDIMARKTLLRMTLRYQEKRSSVQPVIISFNTLLNAYSYSPRAKAAHDAEKVLDWMEEMAETEGLQIRPDAYSYTSVIDCYSKSQTPERAMAVLDRLLQRQVEGYHVAPTVVTFTAALHAMSRSLDKEAPQKAMAMISLMEGLHSTGADLAPTTAVYNSLLTVWKRNSRGKVLEEAVLGILEQMKNKPPYAQPNRWTYTIVLSALPNRNGEHTIVASDLLDEMISSDDPDIHPHTLTYNAYLNTLVSDSSDATESKVQEIFSMLKNNAKLGNSDMRANAQTYNVMMKRAGNSNHPNRAVNAEALLTEMEEAFHNGDVHMRPTDISYCTCIGIWATQPGVGSFARAKAVLERMKQAFANGNTVARPNTVAYSALLKGYRTAIMNGVGLHAQGQILRAMLQTLEEMRESESAKPEEQNYIYVMSMMKLLPRQDERLFAAMARVFDWYHEDFRNGRKMIEFIEGRDPSLLARLKGRPQVETCRPPRRTPFSPLDRR